MDLQLQIATEDHPDQRSIRVHVAQAREAYGDKITIADLIDIANNH